jgi:hypothetical protein
VASRCRARKQVAARIGARSQGSCERSFESRTGSVWERDVFRWLSELNSALMIYLDSGLMIYTGGVWTSRLATIC